MSWFPSEAGFSQEPKNSHPASPSPGYYFWLSFGTKKKFGVQLKIVLKPFVLFTKHKSVLNMQWRKSTKMLSEIHLWACHCPKGDALTRGAQWWNETTEFIKMSGISSVYPPHSVTYFPFVLSKNKVFCPHMNLSGAKKKRIKSEIKGKKKKK